jgi:hypothetical protein
METPGQEPVPWPVASIVHKDWHEFPDHATPAPTPQETATESAIWAR